MAKAYSWIRFATPRSSSAPRDTHAAEEYCRRRKLDLDTQLGARVRRGRTSRVRSATEAALADFLERVRSGEVSKGSLLLLDGVEPFPRPATAIVADVLEKIVGLGVTIVTLEDGVECSRATLAADPTALLYAVVGLLRAQEERALKSRRSRASWKGRRERAQQREPISAICPAWLALDRETGTFRVHAERAKVVQRIFRESLRGVGQAQIAEALDRDGVGVFGCGRGWHRSYVVKLLRSPAVVGTWTPHSVEIVDGRRLRKPAGEAIRNYYPRIIEPEVFRQAQTLVRASRSPLRGRHAKSGKVTNVFGGLAHCGRCGAVVSLVSKGKPPKLVRYLVCSAARVNAGCRHYEAIRYERFERALVRESDWLFSSMPSGERRADLDRLVTEAEARAYAIGDAIEALRTKTDGSRARMSHTERIRELRSEGEKMRVLAESLRAERETTSSTYVRDRVDELREAIGQEPLDRTRVNALLRQVFSAVTVDYDGHDLAFQWRHGGQSEVELGS